MRRRRVSQGLASTLAKAMENETNQDRSNVNHMKHPKRPVSRTRLVMGLLLIVAIAIFIGLANKAVRENAGAIQQAFGRRQ
jgi:cytoskeletal protein RodZ